MHLHWYSPVARSPPFGNGWLANLIELLSISMSATHFPGSAMYPQTMTNWTATEFSAFPPSRTDAIDQLDCHCCHWYPCICCSFWFFCWFFLRLIYLGRIWLVCFFDFLLCLFRLFFRSYLKISIFFWNFFFKNSKKRFPKSKCLKVLIKISFWSKLIEFCKQNRIFDCRSVFVFTFFHKK